MLKKIYRSLILKKFLFQMKSARILFQRPDIIPKTEFTRTTRTVTTEKQETGVRLRNNINMLMAAHSADILHDISAWDVAVIILQTSLLLQGCPGKANSKAHCYAASRWTVRYLITNDLTGRRFTGSSDCQMLARYTKGELQRFPQNRLLSRLV